ncbi:MAG TPA: hypothetical protein VGU90_04040 [Terriglobales bacterium]|nr:hypothetical protein [Terriglobales bacterium]
MVRGYLKTASLLWMRALGVPTLEGIVINDWSDASARAVQRFAKEHGVSQLLLRIDKRHERWTRRRGGYLIPISQAGNTAIALREEGFISLLLEPASPLADEYSMAASTIPDQSKLIVEIVGPGFDASDVLRSDISAHERWEFAIDPATNLTTSEPGRRLSVVNAEDYHVSVEERLAKIGARLENPAFPDEAKSQKDQLIAAAADFLKASNQTALLDCKEYEQIPLKYLHAFKANIDQIFLGLNRNGIQLGVSSFAASVIARNRLVFWDFFPAAREEAALLYPAA